MFISSVSLHTACVHVCVCAECIGIHVYMTFARFGLYFGEGWGIPLPYVDMEYMCVMYMWSTCTCMCSE